MIYIVLSVILVIAISSLLVNIGKSGRIKILTKELEIHMDRIYNLEAQQLCEPLLQKLDPDPDPDPVAENLLYGICKALDETDAMVPGSDLWDWWYSTHKI